MIELITLPKKEQKVSTLQGIIRILLPRKYFLNIKKSAIENSLSILYEEVIIKGFRYFNRVRIKSLAPWFKEFNKLPRSTATLISRIRTHHVNLASHLFEKGMIDKPDCV